MFKVEFDAEKFGGDVASRVTSYGAKHTCCRETGVSCATLNRCINDRNVRDIRTILSLCAYFDLRISDYVRV